MTKVRLSLSQPLHTDQGRIVAEMFYGKFIQSTLARGEFTGYPHNGGEHTLNLHMFPHDAEAFLEMAHEAFSKHAGIEEFISSAKKKLSAAQKKFH